MEIQIENDYYEAWIKIACAIDVDWWNHPESVERLLNSSNYLVELRAARNPHCKALKIQSFGDWDEMKRWYRELQLVDMRFVEVGTYMKTTGNITRARQLQLLAFVQCKLPIDVVRLVGKFGT